MSAHIDIRPEARTQGRRFPDGEGRVWEAIAAPHDGAGAAHHRLYFRYAARPGGRWVPGPIVEGTRFSDARLADLLEAALDRVRAAARKEYVGFGASARPEEWLPDFDNEFELVS